MAYHTGNPIGSTDPRDLYDNAQNLDTAINAPETTWTDRLGNARQSWAGATGYQHLGDYAAGIQVTTYSQVIRASGEYWRAAAGTALPYTTTGAGMPEFGKFVGIGDAVLRGDLVAAGGSDIVGFKQAGAGAIVRTSQDKLRDTVSIADFGASPSASASVNTAAFVAALTAADTQGGATVDVPAGIYLINKVHLTGMTFGLRFARGAVIKAATVIDSILSFSNCTVAVDGAEIDGDSKAARGISATVGGTLIVDGGRLNGFFGSTDFVAGVYASGLDLVSVFGADIRDCDGGAGNATLGDGAGAARAVYAFGCADVVFKDISASNILGEEGDAIHVAANCTNAIVSGCRVRGFTRRGIKVQSARTQVIGNQIFETTANQNSSKTFAGINCEAAECVVSGNNISAVHSPYGILTAGSDSIVTGNFVKSAVNTAGGWPKGLDQRAIVVTGARSVVSNNQTREGLRGIDVGGDHCTVIGNVCMDASLYGLLIGLSSGAFVGGVISANLILSTIAGRMPGQAITLWNLSDAICVGNTMRSGDGTTNNMILVTGTATRNVVANNHGNSEFAMVNLGATVGNVASNNINPASASKNFATPDFPVPLGALGVTTQAASSVGALSKALPIYSVTGVLQGYVPIHATVT